MPRAFADSPPSPTARTSAESILKESGVEMALGDLEAARLLAGQAIEIDTTDPRGYLQRAAVELQLKAFDQAAKDADKAIKLGFHKASVFNIRSEAYAGQGLYQRAFADADIAVGANPASAAGYLNRALARQGLSGLDADALGDFRRASELDARDRPRYDEAKAAFAKAHAARPAALPDRPAASRRFGPRVVAEAAGGAALLVLLVLDWRRRRSRRVRFASVITLPPEGDEPRPGAVLGGRFIVGRKAGRELEADVFDCRDLEDQPKVLRRYALPRERAKRALAVERARAAAAIKHPSVETIDAVIEDGDWLFCACAPAPGEPLHALAARAPQRRLAPEQALRALEGVCAALDAAHQKGVAHGALSAGCIRVERGQAVVVDFGAPRTGARPEDDLFALGACLYEALAGQPAFPGPDAELQRREGRYAKPSSAIPGASEGLDGFFARALAPEPERRYRSASELLVAFRSVVVPLVQ